MKQRMLFCIAVFFFTVFCTHNAKAITYYWVGGYLFGDPTAWDQPFNWAPTGVPGAGDIASIGQGILPLPLAQPTVDVPVTCASIAIGGTYTMTLTVSSQLNVTGAFAVGSSCTVNFANNTSGGAPTMAVAGGITNSAASTIAFTATNPGTASITGGIAAVGGTGAALTLASGVTMNLYSGSVTQSVSGYTFSNAGVINVASTASINYSAGSCTANNSGTITADGNMTFAGGFTNSGGITVENASAFNFTSSTSTFSNTGTIKVTPNTALTANSSFTVGGAACTFQNTSPGTISVTGITGNTTTLFTMSSGGTISNSGGFTASNAPVLLSGSIPTINDAGSMQLTSSPLTVSNTTAFTNSGTFNAASSALTFNGASTSFTNSGTATISASTVTFANSSSGINNSTATAQFTANGSSTITFPNAVSGCFIKNTGLFNAGTANSACSITTGTGINSFAVTNNTGATFNLGSTSIITLANTGTTNPSTITNSGTFTLESDKYGSASIGKSGTPTGTTTTAINQITGTYNVQRFLKGNSSLSYRGYRLLSSPVNLTSTIGAGNVALKYLTTTATIIDPNANGVTTAANVYGAYTGGPAGGGFTSTGGFSNPTIYLYDEHQATSTSAGFTGGKTPGVAAVNGSNASGASGITVKYAAIATATAYNVPVGNGYMMYFIGNNQASTYTTAHLPEDTYLTATGSINQQTVPVKIWWSSSTLLSDASSGASAGYNLVGNPYPSTIDLNKVCSDNGYTIKKFAELSDATGQWANWTITTSGTTISSAVGSDPTYSSEYIASGQGFMVLAPGASQTLNFQEDQKIYNPLLLNNNGTSPTPGLMTTPAQPLVLADANTAGGMALADRSATLAVVQSPNSFGLMHLVFTRDSVTNDAVAICFNAAWADKFDDDDAADLDGNSNIYLSSYSADGVRLAVNREGNYTLGKRIKLFVKGATTGQYTLSLHDISGIDTSAFNVYLVDNLKKDSLDIVRYKNYIFDLSASDTASFHNRFVVAIEKKALPAYQLVSFTGQKATTGIQINWVTRNEGDYTGFVLQKQDASGQYSALYTQQGNGSSNYGYTDPSPTGGNNVYRLQQSDINNNITYSRSITIVYGTVTASEQQLSVYPNPAKTTITINVTATSEDAPNYKMNIFNAAGALMNNKQVNSDNWNEDVSGYKPGIYIIELKTNQGTLVGKTKFVRSY